MDGRDDQLNQQVFEAFDSVTMSKEAQERILSNLKDRQAQLANEQDNVEVPKTTVLPRAQAASDAETGTHAAEVVPAPKHRNAAKWLLPLAAVLLAGIVVVRVMMPTGQQTMHAPKSAAAEDSELSETVVTDAAAAEEGAAEDTDESAGDLGIDPSAEEEAYDGAPTEDLLPEPEDGEHPMGTVDLYPIVEMSDGTVLSALIDGMYTQQLDGSQVSDSLGTAVAHPSDAKDTVECEVFKLADEASGYAVRYKGDSTYWYCVQVDAE